MLTQLNDAVQFKLINQSAWRKNADFWINQYYIHFGLKEFLSSEIEKFTQGHSGNAQILDVGCGSGWLIDVISDSVNYIGIDYCDIFIKNQFVRKGKKCDFRYVDIEENLEDEKIGSLKSDLIVCCMSLIEMPFLENVFHNLEKLLKDNGRIFVIGLDPVVEIYRYSSSKENFNKLLKIYRSSKNLIYISKKIKFNNFYSTEEYFRILYSLDDYLFIAGKFGLVYDDVVTGINKFNDNHKSPVYQFLSLKKI